MIYGYICANEHIAAEDLEMEIQQYAQQKNLIISEFVHDTHSNKINWRRRKISDLLKNAHRGEEIIVYEASDVARSTAQVLEAMESFLEKGIILHLAKYDQVFTAEKSVDIKKFLELMQHIESDFVAKRTTEALARRKAQGLPLGRPKGKLNKYLKLDRHKKDIQKYLDLKISKASIAKLINCHPQTLYNYMEKRNLASIIEINAEAEAEFEEEE